MSSVQCAVPRVSSSLSALSKALRPVQCLLPRPTSNVPCIIQPPVGPDPLHLLTSSAAFSALSNVQGPVQSPASCPPSTVRLALRPASSPASSIQWDVNNTSSMDKYKWIYFPRKYNKLFFPGESGGERRDALRVISTREGWVQENS